MKRIFAGAGVALVGIFVGFALGTEADASAKANWWDLMTAFGTVGASMAAVVIPIWQNFDRRREANQNAVKADWFLANEAIHAIVRLRLCLHELTQNWALKNGFQIQEKGAVLAALKARCIDDQGVILIARAIQIAHDTNVMLGATPQGDLKAHFQLTTVLNHQSLVEGKADEDQWLKAIRGRAERAGLKLPSDVD